MFNSLVDILDYLNPFSENFILKIAFVPSEDFFDTYTSEFEDMMKSKLGFFYQVSDTFKAIMTSVNANATGWEGIQIDLKHYGLGKYEIVNSTAVIQYGEKIRFWIGGLMIFLTMAWVIRKGSTILGSGR